MNRLHIHSKINIPYTNADTERLLGIMAMHLKLRSQNVAADGVCDQQRVSRQELETWLYPEFNKKCDVENEAELDSFLAEVTSTAELLKSPTALNGKSEVSLESGAVDYYAACWLGMEFTRLVYAGAVDTVAPPKHDSVTMSPAFFAELASRPEWREPLLLLVEELYDRPEDVLTLLTWLFPRTADAGLVPVAQQLLATLSLDSQVAYTAEQRQQVWQALIHAHLEKSQSTSEGIAAYLLAPSEYHASVYAMLMEMAEERQVTLLA